MEDLAYKVGDTLVLAELAEWGGNGLVTFLNPSVKILLVPSTLLAVEPLPDFLRNALNTGHERWAYARFVLKKSSADGVKVEALHFSPQARSIPLDMLPAGMLAHVQHIPLYPRQFGVRIFPYWTLTPAKSAWWKWRRQTDVN